MNKDLGNITNRVLVDLAYRAHRIKLMSDYLKKDDELARVMSFARGRTLNNPHPPQTNYSKTRQYLDELADLLLKLIPSEISGQGLRKAQEEARYYGIPKVNGAYPILASR